jgi:hypothetical protein
MQSEKRLSMANWVLVLWVCISLVACEKKQPSTRISVRVPDSFKGYLRLNPCIPTAQDPAVIDEVNVANVSACPTGDVELVVIKPSKTITIPPESVNIRRGNDGLPRAISVQVPQ